MPCARKGSSHTRLDSLCTSENRHSCTYIRIHGDHAQIQDYNDGTHCECTTDYGFTHVSFIRSVAHMRFFSSRAPEFYKLGKFLLKLIRVHHLGKFAPRENNLLYVSKDY